MVVSVPPLFLLQSASHCSILPWLSQYPHNVGIQYIVLHVLAMANFVLKLWLIYVLNRPLGQTLKPLIDSLSEGARGVAFGQNVSHSLRDYEPQESRRGGAESPDFVELNTAIDEVRLAKVYFACYWYFIFSAQKGCFIGLKKQVMEHNVKYCPCCIFS
jgi:hypothetical protein